MVRGQGPAGQINEALDRIAQLTLWDWGLVLCVVAGLTLAEWNGARRERKKWEHIRHYMTQWAISMPNSGTLKSMTDTFTNLVVPAGVDPIDITKAVLGELKRRAKADSK